MNTSTMTRGELVDAYVDNLEPVKDAAAEQERKSVLGRVEAELAKRGIDINDTTPQRPNWFTRSGGALLSAGEESKSWAKNFAPDDDTYVRFDQATGSYIPAEVPEGRSVGDYLRNFGSAQEQAEMDMYDGISIGQFVRQAAVGTSTLGTEGRTLVVGTDTAGGFTVPAPLSAQVIDAVRNEARVLQAGPRLIPMSTKTLDIARVNAVPAGAWRDEGDAIAEEAITFESVQLSAKSVSTLVKASLEFLQDSQESESFVQNIMSESIALAIDKALLYGDPAGAGDADEVEGVKFVTGVNENATVGTPTNYDDYVDAIYDLRDLNYEPNAVIYSPRDARVLAKLKTGITSDNTTLAPPVDWVNIQKLTTNQIDTDEGVGTDESSAFFGDWSKMLVGVRSTLQVRLDETYVASEGAIGLVLMVRTDMQLVRPNAFLFMSGITAS